MSDQVDFAALLCSRLCHDLLSPVGAFNNGLELLADERDEAMRKSCLDLLDQSARAASAKLKFFRLAFGSAGGYGDVIASDEVRNAITGMIPPQRTIEVVWSAGEAGLPKPAAKILLNLALVALDALVRGGRLEIVSEMRDGAAELVVRATGDRLVLDDASRAALSGVTSSASAKTAPILLAQHVAAAHHGEVMMSQPTDTEMVLGGIIRV